MSSEQEFDYEKWAEYLILCGTDGVEPSLRDYAIWLEENTDVS